MEWMDKFKAAFSHVAPDSPEVAPFIEALDKWLHRWYGVGLDDVVECDLASFTKPYVPGENTNIEVTINAPGEKGWHYHYEATFENFGVDGHLTFSISRDAMEASPCFRFETECSKLHGRPMEIAIDLVNGYGTGPTFEKIWITPDEKSSPDALAGDDRKESATNG